MSSETLYPSRRAKSIQTGSQSDVNKKDIKTQLSIPERQHTFTIIESYLDNYFNGLHTHPKSVLTREQQERLQGYNGILPFSAAIYTMMLDEAGLLPKIPFSFSTISGHEKVRDSFNNFFTGKNVFFLPGRFGQETVFGMDHGASAGMSSDSRYIRDALNRLIHISDPDNPRSTSSKLSMLAECEIMDLIYGITPYRKDLSFIKKYNSSSKKLTKIHRMKNPNPDIIVSTNMLNVSRFDFTFGEHYLGQNWKVFINRLLAIGVEKTIFYIIPTIDQKSAFTTEELHTEIGDYADIKVFDASTNINKLHIMRNRDFALSIRLKKTIPKQKLALLNNR